MNQKGFTIVVGLIGSFIVGGFLLVFCGVVGYFLSRQVAPTDLPSVVKVAEPSNEPPLDLFKPNGQPPPKKVTKATGAVVRSFTMREFQNFIEGNIIAVEALEGKLIEVKGAVCSTKRNAANPKVVDLCLRDSHIVSVRINYVRCPFLFYSAEPLANLQPDDIVTVRGQICTGLNPVSMVYCELR